MPLYDYRCGACGREIEVMHGIHERGPATCETCGGAMSKVLSRPAIHFKGSGWAKKDAASASKPKSKGSSSGPSADKDASSSPAERKDSSSDAPASPASTSAGTAATSKD